MKKARNFVFLLSWFAMTTSFHVKAQTDWSVSFDNSEKMVSEWTFLGDVKLDKSQGFKSSGALLLEKTERTLYSEVSATSQPILLHEGVWSVGYAVKSELQSMDNSYQGDLSVEILDRSGRVLERVSLISLYNKNPWKQGQKDIELTENVAGIRFCASIRKETPGKFWVDDLSVSLSENSKPRTPIKRIMFSTVQLGNLIYPSDAREVNVEVWSDRPLSESEKEISLNVKDYWGAEQGTWTRYRLTEMMGNTAPYRYRVKFDMRDYPLEIGRYYEVYATVCQGTPLVYTDYSSFAILPEAEANRYRPEDIPWTSRNWDNRISEYIRLTHRLGIRICGIWGNMSPDWEQTNAPGLDLVEELGMGYLTGSVAHAVEQRSEGWKELLANDGEKIRLGVRNFIEKYKHVRPMIVNLGNEPHAKGEDVQANVEAYRIVYEEIKRIDPSIYVVGTSVGPNDDFARYGYGKWCDAYDFHVYESAESVRDIVSAKYPAMFEKYGEAKPIWSTELGLNSQGMARISVASELYRKSVNFFAGGGASMSWFGLLYPDPEGKNHDSFGSAHNVFDCRYNCYAPKMDAIAYYNMVNSLAIKKYVEDKIYDGNTRAFLFADKEGNKLQVLYNEKGRRDIFLPLRDVTAVKSIAIDGRIRNFHAAKQGITITVSEEPVLLLYCGGDSKLPESLGMPAMKLVDMPAMMVAGEPARFSVQLENLKKEQIELQLPPFWTQVQCQENQENGSTILTYTVKGTEQSSIREADIHLQARDEHGLVLADLSYRPVIAGALSLQVLPNPYEKGKKVSVDLQIRNNSTSAQTLEWDVELYGEQELDNGNFTSQQIPTAYFVSVPSGNLTLAGNETRNLTLEMDNVDLYKVYRIRATVRDALGRVVVQERPVSSFYGVSKVRKKIKVDGHLDEADWKKALVCKLDKRSQFFAFVRREAAVQDWTGPDDLSAEIRYLWDDDYFYVSLDVKDDIAGKIVQSDADLWQQDGLQFLIDPVRTQQYKIGKYEYSIGEGTKGVQTWCTLSATGSVATGNKPDVKVAISRAKDGSGDVVYEIAFPWSCLAPFDVKPGANLGLALIVNEDDGGGRNAYMTWFGNVNSKDVDTVGDLILLK